MQHLNRGSLKTHLFLGQSIYRWHNFWLHIVLSSIKYYGVISNYLNWDPTTQSGNFLGIFMYLSRFTRLANHLDGFMFLPMHMHVKNNTSENSSFANWCIIRFLLGHFLHIKPLLTCQVIWFYFRTLNFWNFIPLKSFNQQSFLYSSLNSKQSQEKQRLG